MAQTREYDSSFDDSSSDEEHPSTASSKSKRKSDTSLNEPPARKSRESRQVCDAQLLSEEAKIQRYHLSGLDAYSRHKKLINDYLLYRADALAYLKRDKSRDKTDWDVLRENHQFVWDEDDAAVTWEKQLARKYYDKLYKEYCIADLSQYKNKKVGLRWRTEKEVVSAKGQFVCGNKACDEKCLLKTWEVNFAYVEDGSKKNALVKLRLCSPCSQKLNYQKKYKEYSRVQVARPPEETDISTTPTEKPSSSSGDTQNDKVDKTPSETAEDSSLWAKPVVVEDKSRQEEFDQYFTDLFL